MSINRVNISGNLTRDPELRATGAGTQVLSLGVAVNDRRRNQQSGEWEDYPNYVDCVVFGSRAEALSRYLRKGSKVAIEGKLRYSSWETKDGQRRSKLEVVVDEIEFLSPRVQGGDQPSYGTSAQQAPAYSAPAPAPSYSAPAPTYGGQAQTASAPASEQPMQQPPVQQAPMSTPPSADVFDEDIPF